MDWLLEQLALTSVWELIAVVLALAYLLLAARQNQLCWLMAFISCGIYSQLMFSAHLYLETFLQICYVVLAVYGWWQWQYGAGKAATEQGVVSQARFSARWHLNSCVMLAVVAAVVALLAAEFTDADAVWLDSFTTVFSLFATWLLTRKAIENWWYWLVIDSVYIYLYASKGFVVTAGLFVIYVMLVIYAIWQWRTTQTEPVQDTTEACKQNG
ncbi:nicotinamide mononucleotide transporter [Pseudidiomarina planktonica]|uniref:Nicotinamide riboside transporter PnuC n=1 Tax=Pseudidiomarina planktonica TaxID=1323738 RepID=A0A1Y6FYI6_9GAMM|nr:nicotinamide riboside transporter PnuC [Pseudidiomarina planktonica]RUO63881.1 nicotinamide mononucleotide transporter [Pseudidiomarina planktonica]SMQ80045.1 nicotinamide mononucleotide transporter [Pseudidiomarina planktonica]